MRVVYDRVVAGDGRISPFRIGRDTGVRMVGDGRVLAEADVVDQVAVDHAMLLHRFECETGDGAGGDVSVAVRVAFPGIVPGFDGGFAGVVVEGQVAASVPASSRPFAVSTLSPALVRAALSHACVPAALVTFVLSIFPLALASA